MFLYCFYIVQCEPGHIPVQGICQPCAKGEYQPAAFSEKCIKCPNEADTRGTGSTRMNQCISMISFMKLPCFKDSRPHLKWYQNIKL